MERGLYIAASGMLSEMQRQDMIANDLANAATPGYKADRTAQRDFGEMVLTNSATGQVVGSQGTAVQVDAVQTDWAPQPARETGEPLDFAIAGTGFFAIQTDAGVRYTRNGQFSVSPEGTLTTAQGVANDDKYRAVLQVRSEALVTACETSQMGRVIFHS